MNEIPDNVKKLYPNAKYAQDHGTPGYLSMIKELEDSSIFYIHEHEDTFVFQELCDQYYEVILSRDQLRTLGHELIALADSKKLR